MTNKELQAQLATSERVANFHNNNILTFKPVDEAMKALVLEEGVKIYESKSGSAYYFLLLDGKQYFIRTSDHWGSFATLQEQHPSAYSKTLGYLNMNTYRPHNWFFEGDMGVVTTTEMINPNPTGRRSKKYPLVAKKGFKIVAKNFYNEKWDMHETGYNYFDGGYFHDGVLKFETAKWGFVQIG